MSESKFKKYNRTTSYSRAGSAVIFYCIEYELEVEIEFLDGNTEKVIILELTNYELIVRNVHNNEDSWIPKHSIKRINFGDGDVKEYIEEFKQDIGSSK